ncbi:MAG: DUF2752 domain-containing protein [Phycisphaerales bacterium]
MVALACLGVLLTAAWLQPDPRGFGTHTQLPMPPCQFLAATGKPCMTCGMTTAFANAAHGNYVRAWRAQPFGLALCVAGAVAFWVGLIGAATGLRIAAPFAVLLRPIWLWTLAGTAGLAWAYKVATWPA